MDVVLVVVVDRLVEVVELEDDVDIDVVEVDVDEVLVLLVDVVDCIIASTKVTPFSPGLMEKEYCWDACGAATTLYPHALAIQEPTMAWSPGVSGGLAA